MKRPRNFPPSLRSSRLFGLVAVSVALAACQPEKPAVTPMGGRQEPKVTEVPTATADGKAAPDVYLPQGPFAEEAFPAVETAPLGASALVLPAAPAGVAAPPAVCAEYLKNKPAAAPACGDRASALAALDQALGIQAPTRDVSSEAEAKAAKARDAALSALEGCAGLPAGLVRALRADLAPAACGDVLAEPVLKAPPPEMRADVHEALVGLALAARLSRAGGAFPTLAPPFTEERVKKHVSGPVAKWMKDVATAVQDISTAASKLRFYGGAIAAVAAGNADLALVETVRAAPIPDEMQKDEERRNVYYAALDEGLEPRKTRGRDAALVGLKRFAEVGALNDARVREARRLLSKLYGGRRIDALDRLMLPAPPLSGGTSVEGRLAARLPTFYAGVLLDASAVTKPEVLVELAQAGLPLAHRQALGTATLAPELWQVVGWAYLALGRTYWRATDFEQAAKAMSLAPAASRTPTVKLLAGLAMGLRGGPRDAAEMMVKSPLGMNLPGQRAALDALAAEGGLLSGHAAFDSAYLMEIAAPEKADGIFFRGVAKRYRQAADLLVDAAQKAEAEERARAAEAIAGEVK